MANQEQLNILKQGVNVWNQWRKDNPATKIILSEATLKEANLGGCDLTEADLHFTNLQEANLNGADLSMADLNGVNLLGANLSGANLFDANLREAILREACLITADLSSANLSLVDLSETDLTRADLSSANLIKTNLSKANLNDADITHTIFKETHLIGTNFHAAILGGTTFTNTDLSNSKDLDFLRHYSASTLGTDTLQLSKGKLPDIFLRGCGLSDWEIEAAKLYNPELTNEERNKILYKIYDLQASQAVQVSPLFISYSHADSDFVDGIEQTLNEKGIRFWRDIHKMKAGRLEKQIDEAIRQNPTVLLVLSEHSLNSDWVEHEVQKARELEKEMERDVLCPIALDKSWEDSKWEKRMMEQIKKYNILDFSEWKDDEKFKRMFVRLIDGLNLYYKKEAAS